jgi:hypothetical protein
MFNQQCRGIPTGYLNALEQRLNETEDALYNSLAELRELRSKNGHEDHSREVVSISSRPANESKASRMEEWKRFPVKELRDLESWWLSVVEGNDLNHVMRDSKKDDIFQIRAAVYKLLQVALELKATTVNIRIFDLAVRVDR